MRIVVAGRPEELRGFALAGVATASCQTPQETDAFLAAIAAAGDVGLLLVSPWIERAAPEALAQVRARPGPPAVLALPGHTDDAAERR